MDCFATRALTIVGIGKSDSDSCYLRRPYVLAIQFVGTGRRFFPLRQHLHRAPQVSFGIAKPPAHRHDIPEFKLSKPMALIYRY